jgi:hypothetical protein
MGVIWCLGMYASASTWLFNAVRDMAALRGEVKTCFWSGTANLAGLTAPGRTMVVKSHEITDPATVNWLAANASHILITLRDPRDAVTSLMIHHGYEFDRALDHVAAAARLCVRFAADRRALVLAYESLFFEKPETLSAVDARLGLNTTAPSRQPIFDRLLRAEVEKHIANMPRLPGMLQDRISGDMLDPATHWHTHHAGRTGEIARWRHKLTAAQATKVEARLAGCFTLGK